MKLAKIERQMATDRDQAITALNRSTAQLMRSIDSAIEHGAYDSGPDESFDEDCDLGGLEEVIIDDQVLSASELMTDLAKGITFKSNKRPNTLYVMASESMGYVKIGRSHDPEIRAGQLRTACPDIRIVAIYPDRGNDEITLHRKFSEFRVGGEWFSVHPSAVIDEILRIES